MGLKHNYRNVEIFKYEGVLMISKVWYTLIDDLYLVTKQNATLGIITHTGSSRLVTGWDSCLSRDATCSVTQFEISNQ